MINTRKQSWWLQDATVSNKILLIVSSSIIAALLLYRIALVYSYNGYIMGYDNNFVYDVLRSLNGRDIYTNPAQPPFAITLYTPLYYNICVALGKLVSVNSEDPIYVYQLCRYVSLFCDIATCIFLYFILKKRVNSSKSIALLCVAGFAAIISHLEYTFSRCDSIYLTFYAAFIYILTEKEIGKTILYAFKLALLTNACIFSKQNGIILPLLVVSWLLFKRERKSVYLYLLFSAALFAGILGIYFYLFDYKFLFQNTVHALQNRIDISWFYVHIVKRSLDSLWILPVYAGLILSIESYVKPTLGNSRPLSILFILQLAFCIGTSLKWGSGAGYFNEAFLLSFVLIGGKFNDWITRPASVSLQRITAAVTPLLLLFTAYTICQGYLFFIQKKENKKLKYTQQKEVRNYLQPQLQSGYVLNLAHPGEDFFKTLFYKEIIVPNEDIVACSTFPDHTFDYTSLKEQISNGAVRYIILQDSTLPKQAWDAPLVHFKKDTLINLYYIYKYQN